MLPLSPAPVRWKRVAEAVIMSCVLLAIIGIAWYYFAILHPQKQAERTVQSIEELERSILNKRIPSQ
jgi:TRAP-type C4-dicarboxylate transport system permease small subunit